MGTKAENKAENPPVEKSDKTVDETVLEDDSEQSVAQVADSGEGVEAEPDQLRVRLEEAYGKNAELQNNYLRKAADLDNLRKRLLREREEIASNAITGLLEDLLPALDAFHFGLEATHGKDGDQEIVKGFAMALEQMNDILLRRGLETIDPAGELFDPALHEALSQEPSKEVDEGIVLTVTRVGYRLNERLLRPAAVIVSKGSTETIVDDSESKAG